MKKLGTLILLVILLGVTACGKSNSKKHYQINLTNHEGTGYLWTYTIDNPEIIEESNYHYKSKYPNSVGGDGTATYTFKGLKPGNATITFTYQRPWEKELPPIETKTYKLVVDQQLNITKK